MTRRPWLFLWAPALTILIGFPLASLPFSGDPRGFWAPYTLLALPFCLGITAARGYLAVLMADTRRLYLTAFRRLWARASLLVGLLCALAGIAGGLSMVLFLAPALWAAIGCILLWVRFERAGRAPKRYPT